MNLPRTLASAALAASAAALTSAPLPAQTSAPLVDLAATPTGLGSFPSVEDQNPLLPFGDDFPFAGWTSAGGLELYRTDGATIELVKDIRPGPAGSLPEELVVWQGWAYFFADDGVHGRELFVTNVTGGHVSDLGLAGGPLALDATAPLLGGATTVRGAFATLPTFLAWTPPTTAASAAFVAPGHALWLDPAALHLQGLFLAATFELTVPVPQTSGLVGARLHAQAGSFDGAAFRTSNGLLFVLGD